MNKNIFQSFKIIVLALVLSAGISYVSAWTAPTATPPSSNVAAPINVGGTAQTKTGDLSAWNLVGNSVSTNSLRVATGAAANKVLTSDASGNATWQPASAGTTYAAGTGLTLTGNVFAANPTQTQTRVSGTCAVGSSISAINQNGTVTCEIDDVGAGGTTYVAGTGLTLTGNTFSANNPQTRVSGTCAVGSSIRAIDAAGGVTCEIDDVGAGGGADNLGNHTATQSLNMNSNYIYGLPLGSKGISWGSSPGAGNGVYSDGPNGEMAIRMSGSLHVQNQSGTAYSGMNVGNVNVVSGSVIAPQVCISGTCKTSWPTPTCILQSQTISPGNCWNYANCPAGWVLTGRQTDGVSSNMCQEKSICSRVVCS